MAKCNACGQIILFGGVREGDMRFCNAKCAEKVALEQTHEPSSGAHSCCGHEAG